ASFLYNDVYLVGPRKRNSEMRYCLMAAGVLLWTPAWADAVQSAYTLCAIVDNTGLASAPCEISGWSGTVTATIDMSSAEARKLCPQSAELMRKRGGRFGGRQWTVEIESPYSGGNSVAYCNLPQ